MRSVTAGAGHTSGAGRAGPARPGEHASAAPPRPRWVLAAAVTAMAALVGLTLLSQLAAGTSTALRIADVVCAVASLAVLPWLLLRPPTPAVLLALLAAVSPAVTPAATLGVLVVAQRRPLRRAALVGVLGVLAHALRGWWRPVQGLSYGWWLVLDVVAHAALVGIGALLRSHAALMRSLRERAVAAEAQQARKVAEARLAERTRIAREMHDVLAHRLSLLATQAGALEYRPDSPPERIAAAAGVVRAGAHEALQDLRQVIGVLRSGDEGLDDGDHRPAGGHPGPDGSAWPDRSTGPGDASGHRDTAGPGDTRRRPQPTMSDVPALVEESRATGLPVVLSDTVDPAREPPPVIGRTAYRIVQEGLTNVRKHAPAGPVTIRISGGPGEGLTVTLSNPTSASTPVRADDPRSARGVTAAHVPVPAPGAIPGSGTGLIGLAERARLAGGRLQHGAEAGQFRLAAWLPWPE